MSKIDHYKRQKQINRKRLRALIQRLKAKKLVSYSPEKREQIKDFLQNLDEQYQSEQIDLPTYKLQALWILLQDWSPEKREQFLYWYGGKFLQPEEIFTLTDDPQQIFTQNLQD
ncbi:hypothetical protein IJJ08_04850 [bacterium]|nr:hypothetical protein [bacterium]